MRPINRRYCPSCPRALICIARNEVILPIAECTKCYSIKQVVAAAKMKKYPWVLSAFFQIDLCECTQQEPMPRSRKLCPAEWADALRDIDEGAAPFVCYECGGRRELPVDFDHFRMT